ncbi:MaoC/PaaZ C-terminal domain-containing protein [Streptomyces sp. NPDC047042]|uniref:MaoC/PaaZ C-terminal domain-containing protein n=1 Tax=Streptomyces sp. NPDC047042 TaxID=3154807 RepID=UPI0033CFFDF8
MSAAVVRAGGPPPPDPSEMFSQAQGTLVIGPMVLSVGGGQTRSGTPLAAMDHERKLVAMSLLKATAGATGLYFDDFSLGQTWVTPARTITEADLVAFSGISGDFNPLHTDEEFSKKTQFGGRIFQGPGVFAVATGLESRLGIKDGTAIAFLGMNWNLRAPVRIGDTIRVHQQVAELRPSSSKPDRGVVIFDVQVVNQRDEVCQDGQWVVMFQRQQ